MTREQKIKALAMIAKGTTPGKAVKLAGMPDCLIVKSRAEAEAIRLIGYEGKIIRIVICIPDGEGGIIRKD